MKIKEREIKKGKCFYKSKWYGTLRKQVFSIYANRCMKCGDKKKLIVDHIKPRSRFPKLELCPNNLQILCDKCNVEKSNKYIKDFRLDGDFYNFEIATKENRTIIAYQYLYELENKKDFPEEQAAERERMIDWLIRKNTGVRFGKIRNKKHRKFKSKKKGKVSKVETISSAPKIKLGIDDQVKAIASAFA